MKHGLLYLCSAFSWRFINLDAAFAHGTTHVYKPSLIAKNAFEVLINDVAKWSFDQGLTNGQFSKLAISPHYWNRKVLSMDLVKDDRKKAPLANWGATKEPTSSEQEGNSEKLLKSSTMKG